MQRSVDAQGVTWTYEWDTYPFAIVAIDDTNTIIYGGLAINDGRFATVGDMQTNLIQTFRIYTLFRSQNPVAPLA